LEKTHVKIVVVEKEEEIVIFCIDV